MIGYLDLFNNYEKWDVLEYYFNLENSKKSWNDSNDKIISFGTDGFKNKNRENQFPYGKDNIIAYDFNEKMYEWNNAYIKETVFSKKNQSLENFIEYLRNEYEFYFVDYKFSEIEKLGFNVNIGNITNYECVYKDSYDYNIEFIVTEKFLVIRDLEEDKNLVIYNNKDIKKSSININVFISDKRKLIDKVMEILNFPVK